MSVLNQVADTIIEKPVQFSVRLLNPEWWERILIKTRLLKGVRVFKVTPITLGNLVRISELMLLVTEIKTTDSALDIVYRLYKDNGDKVARVVATAISNSKAGPSENLVRFISNNMPAAELNQAAMTIINSLDVSNFIRTITLLRGVSLLKTEGIIASGEQ